MVAARIVCWAATVLSCHKFLLLHTRPSEGSARAPSASNQPSVEAPSNALKAAFRMNEIRAAIALADIPYPAPPKVPFEKEKVLIPGGICRIHGMVPHYLYLAIRTSARHEPRHVHKSPEIPRDDRALEKSHRSFCFHPT